MGNTKSKLDDLARWALVTGLRSWHQLNFIFAAAFIAFGLFYVGHAWSPSSYGHVLQQAGATDTGVVWGEPRPIRSDEWAVTTPLTQATVRNNFERYNLTSAYGEDLRINYSMPLRDWGLIFKPTFWPYQLVPAAYAFSWHYLAMLTIFIFGYAHLFRLAKASPTEAFLLSLGIYFSGFVQFFWNSNTTLFSYFPWLIVIATSSLKTWTRGLLIYWVGTCWLIGNFYPPLFISLAIVGAMFIWAYRPDLLTKNFIITSGLAVLAACATSVLYLWDYLFLTAQTSYPGQRTSLAGYYPWHLFLTQFWPSVLFDRDFNSSVSYTNVTGVGVLGLYWYLIGLCFINWSVREVRKLWNDRSFRVLILGLAVCMSWMLLPIPSWVGRFTMLDRVPPERMVFAAGFFILLIIFHIYKTLGVSNSSLLLRGSIYSLFVTAGWLSYGHWLRPYSVPELHLSELIAPVLVWIALALAKSVKIATGTALLCAGVLANALVFGRFNPIQSAHPIFDEPRHLLAQTLKLYVTDQRILPVQIEGLIGATMNGMGFKAIAHLNATPQWSFWEPRLDKISDDDKKIMNRYAHIRLVTSDAIELLENDQVGIPSKVFRVQPLFSIATRAPTNTLSEKGFIDRYEVKADKITIAGWFPLTNEHQVQEYLAVSNSLPTSIIKVVASNQERWDRVRISGEAGQLLSGFVLNLYFREEYVPTETLCIFTRNKASNVWYKLATAPGIPGCVNNNAKN